MITFIRTSRWHCLCRVLFLMWIFALACDRQQTQPTTRNLLLEPKDSVLPRNLQISDFNSQYSKRWRYALLNESFFSEVINDTKGQNRITFNLFEDVNFDVVTSVSETKLPGIISWTGKQIDNPETRILFMIKDRTIVGEIVTLNDRFRIIPIGIGSWHAIIEIDEPKFKPEAPTLVPSEKSSVREKTPKEDLCDKKQPEVPPGKGTRITLLVLYTSKAAQASIDIERDVLLLVSQLETAFHTPNYIVYPVLAHSQVVDYQETGVLQTDLNRLTDKSDGYIDEIHSLRDQYKADLVVLLVEDADYCGIAWLIHPMDPKMERYAFSVSDRQCALNNLTFSHEIGHNIGMRHDRYAENGGNPEEYNYGYVLKNQKVRSIMAYDKECQDAGFSCRRLLTYCAPHIFIKDERFGVPIGNGNAAHNLEVLCRNAPIVSKFRK